MKEHLSQGVQFLSQNGYNLFSITASSSLPQDILDDLAAQNIDFGKFSSLITIGSGGRQLWKALDNENRDPIDPVNCFTERIVPEFIKTYLKGSEIVPLFPKRLPRFPIQTFTHWLGWTHPTPLGKNIHKEFGVWHAYRSVFLATLNLPETSRQIFNSPCATCEDKPCIKACPSGAVSEIAETLGDFNKKTCLPFRLEENSICQDRCLARLACPYAREHKYTTEQIVHHYSYSRKVIQERYPEYHPTETTV